MNGLAWRLLGRELRSGELRLLLAALLVAVAAVTAVGFFTDRVRLALEQESHQLLGGDLLLVADHPWSPTVRDEALKRGLQTAETVIFPSMVLANGQAQLADIKAVSSSYPLRGQLGTAAGKSDKEIVDFMVARYGDFVLYRPPVKGITLLLWGGPVALMLLGLFVLIRYLRRRATRIADDQPLSADETSRADALLKEINPK